MERSFPLTAAFVARAILSAALLVAGLMKVADPAMFARSIFAFHLVPWPVAAAGALYLPWLEIVTAGVLWARPMRAGAVRIACAMFALFSLALASALLRGLDVECGCFGRYGDTGTGIALMRALALLTLTVSLLRLERKSRL